MSNLEAIISNIIPKLFSQAKIFIGYGLRLRRNTPVLTAVFSVLAEGTLGKGALSIAPLLNSVRYKTISTEFPKYSESYRE